MTISSPITQPIIFTFDEPETEAWLRYLIASFYRTYMCHPGPYPQGFFKKQSRRRPR